MPVRRTAAPRAGGAERLPPAWALKEFAGERGRADPRRRPPGVPPGSDKSSFALHRDVVLDLRRSPVLTWTWKVARLPRGDVRDPHRDDQAAQVYVLFPRWPSPRTTSDVHRLRLGFSGARRHDAGPPAGPNVRIIVVESGPARLGTWVREERDVAADYRALFGREPPGWARWR